MLKKRIIPCLDIKNGRVVKGVNFEGLMDAGDPIELARKYASEGADELVLLDISATNEGRELLIDLVGKVAREIDIPFAVGGGIKSVDDVKRILDAGADKVSVNSAAVARPELLTELAMAFGRQCVVLAIDAKLENGESFVFTHGGKRKTKWQTADWAAKGVELGAGEILLTSMNNDGVKGGFDLAVLNLVGDVVNVPIIASGGAGQLADFESVFTLTKATGALAASIFHFNEISLKELKKFLKNKEIPVR
jgi:cyclase